MSGTLKEVTAGKSSQRLATAGLASGGEQAIRRAARFCLRATQERKGGREDSAAGIQAEVGRKQLVDHLWT